MNRTGHPSGFPSRGRAIRISSLRPQWQSNLDCDGAALGVPLYTTNWGKLSMRYMPCARVTINGSLTGTACLSMRAFSSLSMKPWIESTHKECPFSGKVIRCYGLARCTCTVFICLPCVHLHGSSMLLWLFIMFSSIVSFWYKVVSPRPHRCIIWPTMVSISSWVHYYNQLTR